MEYLIATILLIAIVKNLKYSENVDYKKYLQSRHWQRKRRKALKRFGYRCALCGSKKNLHVHHNSYKHLGHERKYELVCLCAGCHGRYHGNLK